MKGEKIMTNKEYKEWLIEELLNRKNIHCTRKELENYRITTLENLYDNVD